MALAFDSAASGGTITNVALAWTHTLIGGTDTLLIVAVYFSAGVGGSISITVDSVPMALSTPQAATPAANVFIQYGIGMGYAAGNRAISVTASALATIYGDSVGYTNATQSGQPAASTSGDGGGVSTGTVLSLSGLATTDWAVVCAIDNSAADTPTASGMTFRHVNSATPNIVLYDSAGPIGSSSVSTTITFGGATHNYDGFLIAISDIAGGGGGGVALRRNSQLAGLGASGPFFQNPLAAPSRPSAPAFVRRGRIYVPAHVAQGTPLERAGA